MRELAPYFEQEAAAISRAGGLGSPATSNPCLGVKQPPLLSPPSTGALVHGDTHFPAFLKTLPDACQLSAFIFSLKFSQDVMRKEEISKRCATSVA